MKSSNTLAIGFLSLALAWLPGVAASTDAATRATTTYLVIYRPGPAWPQGKKVSELPLKEHWHYMLGLYAKGVMKSAGPLTDNTGGAVVLEVASDAEAKEIVVNDPAVKAGIFVHELHSWAPVPWENFLAKQQGEGRD